MVFTQYPYINISDFNLDYILKRISLISNEVENFVSINAIKFAKPIQWNITTQYEKNTIVIDPVTGTAYISVAPVPAGVALTRTEYWTVVFDLSMFVTKAAQNLTSHWEKETTTTATFASNEGDWLVWGDVLFVALTNITAGDQYIVDSNIKHFTIEELYNSYLSTVGVIADLITSDTSNLVNAINSVLTDLNNIIGDLNDLLTDDKSNIVNAINTLVGERVLVRSTVADVIADVDLKLGDVVCTLGYNSIGDYGGAYYLIVNSGRFEITLSNGLYGRIMHNGTVNIAQYGASTTNGDATQSAFNTIIAENITNIIVPKGDWKINGTVEIKKNLTIRGIDMLNSRITELDINSNMFDIGDSNTNAAVCFDSLSLWNDPSQTSNPDKLTNAPTGANNTIINIIKGVGSTFNAVKVNRAHIAINIGTGNYTIDVTNCKLHSNDRGVIMDGNNQAINICLTDFDNDLIGVVSGSGIGAIIVDKCQIENCRTGVQKTTSGDIIISNSYFDANGRRSIDLSGALRKIIISNNIFLENSLTGLMVDATSATGDIMLYDNVVNSINATDFYRGVSAHKYEMGTVLVGSATLTNNTGNLNKVVYDTELLEKSTYGVLTGNAANSPLTIKRAYRQYVYYDSSNPVDFTLDLTDVNNLPNYSQITIFTSLGDNKTLTITGGSVTPSTYTNTSGSTELLFITLIKRTATNWTIKILK